MTKEQLSKTKLDLESLEKFLKTQRRLGGQRGSLEYQQDTDDIRKVNDIINLLDLYIDGEIPIRQ